MSTVTVTDDTFDTVAAAGVVSIPTLNFYAGGQLVTSIVGARPKQALVAEIEEVLA
jgi:thioredoxin 1